MSASLVFDSACQMLAKAIYFSRIVAYDLHYTPWHALDATIRLFYTEEARRILIAASPQSEPAVLATFAPSGPISKKYTAN